MKKGSSYTLTSFHGNNAYGCIYILLTFKNKKRIFSIHQLSYFGDMFLNGISLNFCKKPRNVGFYLNSVFSLSYKIGLDDLRFIFMERITNTSNKNCSEFNFLQKTQRAHMFISPRSGGRRLEFVFK